MRNKYDDIINLPRHISKNHPPMPLIDRAAQFSPFAALNGHDAAVKETARLTETRIELDEYMKEVLNHRLQIIIKKIPEEPEVKITYFQPDKDKEGGSYIDISGVVKKVDEYKRVVFLDDYKLISIDEIISIEGEMF